MQCSALLGKCISALHSQCSEGWVGWLLLVVSGAGGTSSRVSLTMMLGMLLAIITIIIKWDQEVIINT